MSSCDLSVAAFRGATKDDPLLDEHWKCRVCGMLAGQHSYNVELRKAIKIELRETITEALTTIIGKKRSLDESISKTNPAYEAKVLDTIRGNPAKFIPNWTGNNTGNTFLSTTQCQHLDDLDSEAAVVANMYHILRANLLPQFPAGYDLINSEKYAWIPPSFGTVYDDNITSWYAPALFIAPKYMVNYQGPYENAATKSGNMNISYGRLETIRHYPYTFLFDVQLDPICNHIGTFFHYIARPTSWFSCSMKGLLLTPTTFILVEFFNGFITYYCRGTWETKGSEELVKNFCVPVNTTMNDCLRHALSVYNRNNPLQSLSTDNNISSIETEEEEEAEVPAFNFKIVQYSSVKNPFTKTGIFGSATLGAGAYGSVFKVIEEYSSTVLALKIVLETSSRRCSVCREFDAAQTVQRRNPDLVIGVVPDSLLEEQCVNTVTYHAYLMSTVGVPFPPYYKVGRDLVTDEAVNIFQLLFQLHVAGYIHGDAQYVNCLKVISRNKKKTVCYRWIDFLITYDVLCPTLSLVKTDVSTF